MKSQHTTEANLYNNSRNWGNQLELKVASLFPGALVPPSLRNRIRETKKMSRLIGYYAKSIMRSVDNKLSEWSNSLILLGWAYILWDNPNLWDSSAYSVFSQTFSMPQEIVMLICTVVGGFRLLVLAINGTISKSPHLRTAASLASWIIWFQFFLAFYWAGAPSTAIPVYAVLTITDFVAMLRAARDARVYDEIVAGDNGNDGN